MYSTENNNKYYANNDDDYPPNQENQQNNSDHVELEMPLNGLANLEKRARIGFIRKVYLIITVQLCITALCCVISMVSDKFADFQKNNFWLFYLCIGLYIFSAIPLICSRSLSRNVPYNYILLFIFTFAESYMVSCCCSSVGQPKIVLLAAALTAGITIALTIYAFTTKSDFTMMGGLLFIGIVIILIMSLFLFISGLQIKILYVFVSGFGAFICGLYLIYDTQLLMGSKAAEYEIDDYVIAAMMIYLDIIILFLRLLQILAILFGKN